MNNKSTCIQEEVIKEILVWTEQSVDSKSKNYGTLSSAHNLKCYVHKSRTIEAYKRNARGYALVDVNRDKCRSTSTTMSNEAI